MPVLQTYDWESGVDPTPWATNLDSPDPTTIEVSSVDPIDGSFSKRLVFDSFQDYYVRDISYPFNRSAEATPTLQKISFITDDLTQFNRFFVYNRIDYSGDNFIGVEIRSDGSLGSYSGSLAQNGFNGNTLLGATASGVVGSGVVHTVSFRVVSANSPSGEFQLDVDGTNQLDITGVDTTIGNFGGSTQNWGWELFISTAGGATGNAIRFDNHTFGDDEAEPLESGGGGGGAGVSGNSKMGLHLGSLSLT